MNRSEPAMTLASSQAARRSLGDAGRVARQDPVEVPGVERMDVDRAGRERDRVGRQDGHDRAADLGRIELHRSTWRRAAIETYSAPWMPAVIPTRGPALGRR